jgi:2-polyprenyl-3-methyl-5-hydroxy-6-metoxy-1,4-benzoquinol methylase
MRETNLQAVYTRYAETRPGAPITRRDQLSIREPVFRKFFLPVLPPNREAKILDIGCGYGEFLCFLARMGYTQTLGIDLDSRELAVARSLGVRNVRQAEIASALREYHEEFEVISALDVLEHVPKARVFEFLSLVLAALRPGGTFLCQVPNLAAFYAPLFYMDFTHETPFTATSLKQALQMAGLDDVHIHPMGPVAHGLRSAVRSSLWWTISFGLRLIQFVESARWDPLASIYTAAMYAVAKKGRA